MPFVPHTLVGLGPFGDQGCKIVFTKDEVNVIIIPLESASSKAGEDAKAPVSGVFHSRPPQ